MQSCRKESNVRHITEVCMSPDILAAARARPVWCPCRARTGTRKLGVWAFLGADQSIVIEAYVEMYLIPSF